MLYIVPIFSVCCFFIVVFDIISDRSIPLLPFFLRFTIINQTRICNDFKRQIPLLYSRHPFVYKSCKNAVNVAMEKGLINTYKMTLKEQYATTGKSLVFWDVFSSEIHPPRATASRRTGAK